MTYNDICKLYRKDGKFSRPDYIEITCLRDGVKNTLTFRYHSYKYGNIVRKYWDNWSCSLDDCEEIHNAVVTSIAVDGDDLTARLAITYDVDSYKFI